MELIRFIAKSLLPRRFWLVLRRQLIMRFGKLSAVRSLLGIGGGTYQYTVPTYPAGFDVWLSDLTNPPLFSIVTPTWNTPPALLDAMLGSVKAQWYPNWELILSDDASSSAETRAHLATINDPRIKVLYGTQNSGISGATNCAIAAANGDYIVFLDHDDELTVDCLYELACAIVRTEADYLYSDEDKISTSGEFIDPYFKPDWSPDTLMSLMYTCHVSCIRRSLVELLGGLRSDYDGSQDWDLILRATEIAQRIAHVPKVLYHWRMIPGSAASSADAKPYAIEAGRRAREDAMRRRGLHGEMEPVSQVPGYFRARYAAQGNPLVSIIIPSKDNVAVLRACIASIRMRSTWSRYELVLLDNGSVNPETLQYLDQELCIGATVVRHEAPFNYSELNNIGARAAKGDVLLFLNDDTEVLASDWLERMLGFAALQHVGAVGAKLIYPHNKGIQHSGVVNLAPGPAHAFPYMHPDEPGYFMRNLLEHNWSAVTGACLMVERKKYDAVEGFDETFPVAYNDVDFCLRLLKRGLFNVVASEAKLLHHESISRGNDLQDVVKRNRLDADRARLYLMHPDAKDVDPYHNANLDQSNPHFELPFS